MRAGLLILLVLVVCASAMDSGFQEFITRYNKQYSSDTEKANRFETFKANLMRIEEHNKVSSFQIGVNEFADMSPEEFVKTKLSVKPAHEPSVEATFSRSNAPTSVDWRTNKNPVVVAPVRNSGQCGASDAVAIVDSIAADYAIVGKDDVYVFDPAYITDCDGQGCKGGNEKIVWSFIQKFGLQWFYTQCPSQPGLGICIGGFNCTKSGGEAELADAVARIGPIVITIDASQSSFQLYKSGVYYEAKCSSTSGNHDLLLVGYGSSNGQDYWIARNSWGTTWGQSGDILLARNRNNNCGVATNACYARTPRSCVCATAESC